MLQNLSPSHWISDQTRDRMVVMRDQVPRCLPSGVRRWLASRNPKLVAVAGPQGLELYRVVGDARESVAFVPLDKPASDPLRSGGGAKRAPDSQVELELPASSVLTRQLLLPVQVRDRLQATLGLELDRLTPFARSDAYYDARVLETRASQVRVELAVCRRDAVKPYQDALRAAGMQVAAVTWPGSWPRANLLPIAERPPPNRLSALLNLILVLCVVALAAAVLITPLWQSEQQQRALDRELSQLRRQGETVAALREELEKARASNLTVVERSRAAPRLSDLMRELTDLLPDDTWIQTLNYREGSVDMRGQSGQASALISLLEQGPGISGVTFRSPVMQIASNNKERFHIAFEYRRPDKR